MNKKNKKSPIIPIIAVVLVAVLMFSGFQLLMAVFSPANTEENKITTTNF